MDEVFNESNVSQERETYSPKRDRDDTEAGPTMGRGNRDLHSKRLRKIKVTVQPIEKDRTRGRYACLGHRMKHKRCPLDCPERRPKPQESPSEGGSPVPMLMEPTQPVAIVVKNRTMPRTSAKKNVLKLEDCSIAKNTNPTNQAAPELNVIPNWDSVAWEGFGWDAEHCLRDDNFMDLKSSHHWEESKMEASADNSKSMDDLTKFEEDEIIDSWLNEDGFGGTTQEFEVAERNPSETDLDRRASPRSLCSQLTEMLSKILLTRDMLERWLTEPYFNRLVKGCFVRVKIGECLGTPVHRIAHIDEVFDTCYYAYSLSRGQTSKGLALQVGGSSKKTFPILAISNQPPTEEEIRTWQEEMEKSCIILDPLEVQQKEEIVRVLHIKYPMVVELNQPAEPLVKEPAVWSSC